MSMKRGHGNNSDTSDDEDSENDTPQETIHKRRKGIMTCRKKHALNVMNPIAPEMAMCERFLPALNELYTPVEVYYHVNGTRRKTADIVYPDQCSGYVIKDYIICCVKQSVKKEGLGEVTLGLGHIKIIKTHKETKMMGWCRERISPSTKPSLLCIEGVFDGKEKIESTKENPNCVMVDFNKEKSYSFYFVFLYQAIDFRNTLESITNKRG